MNLAFQIGLTALIVGVVMFCTDKSLTETEGYYTPDWVKLIEWISGLVCITSTAIGFLTLIWV